MQTFRLLANRGAAPRVRLFWFFSPLRIIIFFFFYQAVSQPLNYIVQIVLENAHGPIDVTEVVTGQRELLILQILTAAATKYPFPVRIVVYVLAFFKNIFLLFFVFYSLPPP